MAARDGLKGPRPFLVFLFLAGTIGCNKAPEETLAQAYIAPLSVNLRSQLNQKNTTATVLKHGDRVSLIDVRRRYVKVRTSKGAEGWIDSLDLLSPEDMQRITREREQARRLPPEGSATAYETLNIHLDPSRRSPAFAQVPEGGALIILGHRVSPKVAPLPRPSLMLERSRAPARKQKNSRRAKAGLPPPPLPPAPKPPVNWTSLWGAAQAPAESTEGPREGSPDKSKQSATAAANDPKKRVVLEDWTLVRTKDGAIGWVLARNLMMSIPDEVAQYAEGKHITSFFELGTVEDEEKGKKHSWLWTTSAAAEVPDFDSWRVFLWNRRRHRYETSYRQRDVEGYFPVHVDSPDPGGLGRAFYLITKDDDGKFRRRCYRFDGVRVHLAGTEDYRPGERGSSESARGLDTRNLASKLPQAGWLKRKWSALMQRFSKR